MFPRNLKRFLCAACAAFLSTAALGQANNDELRDQITALGVVHNIAFPPSLAPEPITAIIAGSTAYATNFGLKYVPPVLIPPITTGALPNSDDSCSYVLPINGAGTKTRQDFLGLLQSYEDDFLWSNFLRAPEVFHVNTDVAVSVHMGGTGTQQMLTGTAILPVGTHQLRWHGQTLVTPLLDFPPWHLLLAKPIEAASKRAVVGLKTPQARRAAMQAIVELAINLGIEGATFGIDWLALDGIPTPANGWEVVNDQYQTVRIFDRTTPVFDVRQQLFTVEATRVGGEFLSDHIAALRGAFDVTDTCNRVPFVNYAGPPFLPVGEITDIRWTARDAGPVDMNGGFNTSTLTQQILVQDTMPPILLPPPGRVVEADTETAVDIGKPGVFDLADVRPVVTNNAPATFQPNTRTLVEWTATDRSGNSGSENQWITLKTPGSNTQPVADAQAIAARTFEPVVIELSGTDNDLLSSRYDQLSFSITTAPATGFFVAPLLPYFIEDHRVENAFGLNKFALADFVNTQCAADPNNYVPPADFVTDPRYITVDDNGITYVSDKYFSCSRSNGAIERRNRIARFIKDENGELQFELQIETGDEAPDSLSIGANGSIYYRGIPVDSFTDVVRGCDANLGACAVYRIAIDTSLNNPDRLFPTKQLTSFVVDANDVLYVTDGRTALAAYDLRNVNANFPAVLGSIAGIGDLQTAGQDRKDMAIDSEGNLYLSDFANDRVYKFAASTVGRNDDGSVDFIPGEFIGWLGRCETNLTTFRACDEIAKTSIGYACTSERCGVTQSDGTAPGQFNRPQGIAIDANDVLYVTDHENFRVQRFTPLGYFAGEAASTCDGSCFVLGDFGRPEDVTVNLQFFYVLDTERDLLHVFETTPITDFDDDTLQPTQRARVTYQSKEGVKGTDTFAFAVSDGLATSVPATVTINVTRNQRSPIATEDQVFAGVEDEVLDFQLAAFDPDADDQPILTYAIEQQPDNGTITGIGPDFSYTPNADFFGADTFVFSVSDGVTTSNLAEATLQIAPVNDPALLSFANMNDRYGTGFPIKAEVNLNDVDLDDMHVYGIDWGPGGPFKSGRALPPGQVAAAGEPTFVQSAAGIAVLVDEVTHFESGVKTITVCVSEAPGISQLTSCADPNVTAVATRTLTVTPMVRKAIVITDSAPTEVDSLGIEWPVPITDGDFVTVSFTLHNLEPNDVGVVLDATNVVLSVVIEEGLEIGPGGLIAVVGDAVNASCAISANQVNCTADSIPSPGQMTVTVEIAGNGRIAADTEVPVVVIATSDEEDHNGMVGNVKGYPMQMNPDGDADGDGVLNRDDAFPGDPFETSDFDADGIGDNADRDDDNDLVSDNWELRFGFDPFNAGDATLDGDADQLTNAQEYAQGTRPDVSDSDRDSIDDASDNCPVAVNRNQYDRDADGQGDACDADGFAGSVSLGELGGDSGPDYALVRTDAGRYHAFIKDGVTNLSIGADRIDLGATADGKLLAVTASGDDLAALTINNNGLTTVRLIDTITGTTITETDVLDPDWALTEMVAAGADIWMAAADSTGNVVVQRIEAATGVDRGVLTFGSDLLTLGIAPLASGDAVLLAVDEATGSIVAEVRATSDGSIVSATTIAGGDTLFASFAMLADGYAVVAQDTSGSTLVSTWSADGTPLGSFTAFDSDWTVLGMETLPDWSGAGDGLAIAAVTATGAYEVRVFDAGNGAEVFVHNYASAADTYRAITVAPAGGTSEVGLLLADADNAITLEIQDAESSAGSTRAVTAESSAPPPPPPPPPPSTGGGGGGGSIGFVMLFMFAVLVASRASARAIHDSARMPLVFSWPSLADARTGLGGGQPHSFQSRRSIHPPCAC